MKLLQYYLMSLISAFINTNICIFTANCGIYHKLCLLQVIIFYNVLCIMHTGRKMYCMPCYKYSLPSFVYTHYSVKVVLSWVNIPMRPLAGEFISNVPCITCYVMFTITLITVTRITYISRLQYSFGHWTVLNSWYGVNNGVQYS